MARLGFCTFDTRLCFVCYHCKQKPAATRRAIIILVNMTGQRFFSMRLENTEHVGRKLKWKTCKCPCTIFTPMVVSDLY